MSVSCSLVIGSSGFIGKNLCAFLDKKHTYTISRKKKSNLINSNHFFLNINNKNSCKSLIEKLYKKYKHIDIFFLAGESSVEKSMVNLDESFINSLKGFNNIITLVQKKRSTIVIASTGAVYDSRFKKYFHEKDALYPPSSYAASKYAIEGLALSYFESFNTDVRIARIFSVFGEDMKRFFIFDLVKKLNTSKNQIILEGSGKQERDYLHVKDVVKGLILISKKGQAGEIYNLSSGKSLKLKDLAENIKNILNKKNIKIIWNKKITSGIRDSWYGNNSKLKKLGFEVKNTNEYLIKSVIKINSNLIKK